jgi:hypothetical protein
MMRPLTEQASEFTHSKHAASFAPGWNFSYHFHIIFQDFFGPQLSRNGSG